MPYTRWRSVNVPHARCCMRWFHAHFHIYFSNLRKLAQYAHVTIRETKELQSSIFSVRAEIGTRSTGPHTNALSPGHHLSPNMVIPINICAEFTEALLVPTCSQPRLQRRRGIRQMRSWIQPREVQAKVTSHPQREQRISSSWGKPLEKEINPIRQLGIYPEKTIIQKDTCTPMFIAALFTIARSWKQPKRPSTDKWIKKMWYIYIQWNITQP